MSLKNCLDIYSQSSISVGVIDLNPKRINILKKLMSLDIKEVHMDYFWTNILNPGDKLVTIRSKRYSHVLLNNDWPKDWPKDKNIRIYEKSIVISMEQLITLKS